MFNKRAHPVDINAKSTFFYTARKTLDKNKCKTQPNSGIFSTTYTYVFHSFNTLFFALKSLKLSTETPFSTTIYITIRFYI
jgi:hypothetical protein